jgi:hypothetical protein
VLKLPKEVLDVLQNQVFGFDTFFVTGQEPYEGGVLFKGNMRGDSSKCYVKLSKRLKMESLWDAISLLGFDQLNVSSTALITWEDEMSGY